MTQQENDTIFQVDIKWVVGIIISIIGLNLTTLVQIIKLYERLTIVETEIVHLARVDSTRDNVTRDLAIVQQQLEYLRNNQESIKKVCDL